jgi:hypothetical protein
MRAIYPASRILVRFVALIIRMSNIVACEGAGYILEGSRNKSEEKNSWDETRDSWERIGLANDEIRKEISDTIQ